MTANPSLSSPVAPAPTITTPAAPAAKHRLLLVDDHPIVREGLAQFINSEPAAGGAAHAASAMDQVAALSPDLVVADLSLTGKPGLELVKDLASMYPSLPVLVLSIHDEMLWAERVLRAGAEGYINKGQATAKIVAAIRHILAGGIWVSDAVNAALLQKQVRSRRPTPGSPLGVLSDRELEVFQAIGRGMTVKEIAAVLHLSSKTVDVHRDHIRDKLGVRSSTELIRYAVSHVLADN
jgi:DNA-binding NarL/FixJ family response regulator